MSPEVIALSINVFVMVIGAIWAVSTIRVTVGKLVTAVDSLTVWVTDNDKLTREHAVQIAVLETKNEITEDQD